MQNTEFKEVVLEYAIQTAKSVLTVAEILNANRDSIPDEVYNAVMDQVEHMDNMAPAITNAIAEEFEMASLRMVLQ